MDLDAVSIDVGHNFILGQITDRIFGANSLRPLRPENSRTSKATFERCVVTFERCVVFAFQVDNLLILTGFSEEKTIIIAQYLEPEAS